MNKQISAAWKPLAALGLALALAGCNGTNGAAGGTTGGSGATGASGDTLATVGGTPITRTELNKILEAQSGAQVLPVLIDSQLLIQEGKDKGIAVSEADVDAELERQKKLSPELTQELTKNPKLVDAVKTQVRRNLVTQRLLTKDVKAPDADVKKFFDTYKSYYQDPAKVKVGTLLTSTKARADAMSRALKDKSKTFEQLVEEQKKAQDPLASRSSLGETFAPVDTLPMVFGADEAKSIEKLAKGGTTDPKAINVGAGQPIYVLFHVTDRQEPTKVDFATLKPQVETDYKMAQIAMKEVKKNPQNPSFDETLKRTRDAIRGQSQDPSAPAPSLRDVLTIILRPLQQNLLTDLRAKGTVKIDDASYTAVADQYKAIPTPVPPGAATAGAATGGAATGGAATGGAATGATNAVGPAAGATTDGPVTNAAPAPGTAPATNATPAMEAPATAPATNAAPAPAAP